MKVKTWMATIAAVLALGAFAAESAGKVEIGYLEFQGTEYWDLNNDGIVDLELRDPGKTDAGFGRWYKIDNDYDGRYDREVEFRGKDVGRSKHIRSAVAPIKKLRKIRVDKDWFERKKTHPHISR